ncbi:potassium transporter TrkA [Solemya pervernicosa gill symbiont]|uniref:Potassium transporter TrkA n=2 Tax=Gammaproteobacteria incertae sedis TaxID=118884 RepID=A0A1T2L9X0_9GAMM|nr:NAD-binding protein [Candidatus Reidiella endopervernicosa]OOZ41907.1 potassium transporter TrkA [Solemya pervernicosa gill symbiont]QKQ24869.1 NAD-binding protein [Candidatus Reidiella endopervernicosa]
MNRTFFLILRRMRAPLIFLIAAYAISVLGMVLMPGLDDQGNPWNMDFFHAFYFTSFMATTIGFGEIPYEFTDAQRMWAMVSIYITVISWLYAIGTIIGLMQEPAFKQARTENAFARSVRRISEPFYLICGFGDTGSLLIQALTDRGRHAVAVDIQERRANALALQDFDVYVPGSHADASKPENLIRAGLQLPNCAGLIALTDDDHANLCISITGRLLRSDMEVICRAESHDVEANIASFGTQHIIDPFDAFAEHLAMAIHSTGVWLLHEWLTEVPNTPLAQPLYPPRGTWIICGYGRFGKAVTANLRREGIDVIIIEADPDKTDCEECVIGRGTEAETLIDAGIHDAVGIVAGTDNDANNLSIVITARDIKPDLFVVMRQNKHSNDDLFRTINADIVMQASQIIAHEILALLTAPLLAQFLRMAREHDNDWANQLISRISAVTGDFVPEIWGAEITMGRSAGVHRALANGWEIRLEHLLHDPSARERDLASIPLLHERRGKLTLLPDEKTALRFGDRLLFCGSKGSSAAMQWSLQNHNALTYIMTGRENPDGSVWRWLEGKAKR